jgi:hypothetical protein
MPATQAACLRPLIDGEWTELKGLAEGEELKTNILHVLASSREWASATPKAGNMAASVKCQSRIDPHQYQHQVSG